MGCERRVVYDFVNVIQGEATLNQALIKDKNLENLFILPASQTRDKDNLTAEGVEQVINELKKYFDWIICDSPAGIERGATLAMRHADMAVVVTNPEVSSVRDSDRIIGLLDSKTLKAERGVSVRSLLLPIAKNPLILACLGGALVNLSGLGLPGGSERLLGLLAAASLPLGLLCVGAALKPEQLSGEGSALASNSLLRLCAMPLLAWAVAYALQLPAMETSVLVLFFALPTAPTAYVLTRQLGGDSQLMAGIITLQTLLAAVSLTLLLAVLP
jgi:predicted permease